MGVIKTGLDAAAAKLQADAYRVGNAWWRFVGGLCIAAAMVPAFAVSGHIATRTYDSLDRITAITYPTGTTLGILSGITYNADNNLKGWTWSDTSTQLYSYNSYGLLSGYNLGFASGTGTAAGAARTLTRDTAGRITGYTHANNGTNVPALNQTFTYDNLNRLLSANLNGSTTQYTFDASGNRLTKVVGATTYTNTISGTSNRVTQTQDVGGTFSVTYDSAGNITADGSNTFTYSDRGRMASATNGGGTVNYKYNALNQRVSKIGPVALVPTGAAYFVYDEQGQLLGEYDANGAPNYETIYLGALPVGVMKRTGTPGGNTLAVTQFNIHADHLGAPRIITRPSDKAIVWRWDTAESYGGSVPNENPNALGSFSYNQRFPGQVFDAETGLFQNWNREYDPRGGRYRQSDPIGLAGGINTYSYVDSDPLSFVDEDGLTKRGGSNPRATMPMPGNQRGGWGNGQFYPSLGDSLPPRPPNRPPDSALVCRAGTCGAQNFTSGSGVIPGPNGTLNNVSTQCRPGATREELSAPFSRYNQVGFTTVGQIRALGGQITLDGHAANPNHASVNGLTATQLQQLFTPAVRNPSLPAH